MRVLVAEDQRTLAGFVARALEAEGYAVTVVHDGPEAEAAARSGDYGLVLLDVMLPGRSGREVLHAIRAERPRSCRCSL